MKTENIVNMNKTIIIVFQIIIFLVFIKFIVDGDPFRLFVSGLGIGWWFTRNERK